MLPPVAAEDVREAAPEHLVLPALDAAAVVVRDLVVAAGPAPRPRLLNVVHPRRTPWHAVFAAINAHLGRAPLPLVPFAEWLANVEVAEARGRAEDLARIVSTP